MLLPLLHTHEGELCDHRAVLFWGRAFPSCYNSSRKQTQARTASASSHYHKGQKRAGLPPHLLPASRCSLLKHRCPASTPGMIMASLPYGNIHPKYPALIFLPSPRNAKPWGRKILPGEGASHQPGSLPALQEGARLQGQRGHGHAICSAQDPKTASGGSGDQGLNQLWAEGY